eukprot:PRCOL_00000768-RA
MAAARVARGGHAARRGGKRARAVASYPATSTHGEDSTMQVNLGSGLNMSVQQTVLPGGDVELLLHVRSDYGGGAPDVMLHWGLLLPGSGAWVLPPENSLPPASKVHKRKAIQSPFYRDDQLGHAALTMVVPAGMGAEALTFVMREGYDNWLKDGRSDFVLPLAGAVGSISDELARAAAYAKWELAGKPALDEEAAYDMFEAAVTELQRELRSGAALADLEVRLLGKSSASSAPMIEVRAYVRWEEGGMRDLPPDEQQREFDAAAAEMWAELEAGASLQDLQDWLDKGPFGDRPSSWLRKDPNVTYVRPGAQRQQQQRRHDRQQQHHQPQQTAAPVIHRKPKGDPNPPAAPPGRQFGGRVEDMLGAGGTPTHAGGVAEHMVGQIVGREGDAERSFMHRYNIASELLEGALHSGDASAAVAVTVWLRYAAAKLLKWNNDYNVKPRELSAAQIRLTDLTIGVFADRPELRELSRLIMAGVGRGGEGDVGQRIRDEILVIQRQNDQMGGMMEEWHQKLHNNTCPDDVAICQALMDHIESGFDMGVYWGTLEENGIDAARLASYDRKITSEPSLNGAHGNPKKLYDDLANYLRSLKAVHSGADLESAVESCLGYSLHEVKGKGGSKDAVREVTDDHELVAALGDVVGGVGGSDVESLMARSVDCRRRLLPLLRAGSGMDRRALKDVLYLDLALENTFRSAAERMLAYSDKWGARGLVRLVGLAIENCAMSFPDNDELVYCCRDWDAAVNGGGEAHEWALRVKAAADRTSMALASATGHTHHLLQPTAESMGHKLHIDGHAVASFTEEVVRASPGAPLSQLLARLDPLLRDTADLGAWQVIAPYEATGLVVVVDELQTVMNDVYSTPTIVVAGHVSGEEEIPEGAVAVLTPDMPDVLSHVSVRARNEGVCFASCFDAGVLSSLRGMEGKTASLKPNGPNDLLVAEAAPVSAAPAGGVQQHTAAPTAGAAPGGPSIERVRWCGSWAFAWDDYRPGVVGAKSNNVASLRGKLPAWINLPSSAALPFGVFDELLKERVNAAPAQKLAALASSGAALTNEQLEEARAAAQAVRPSPEAAAAIKAAMQQAGLPMPVGEERWEAAFAAAARVWASKWNERAYVSCRKAGIDHNNLSMAVLIQEVVQPQYAFVLHTSNPVTGDSDEIYGELVFGLGETLVGNYPGRALSFTARKGAGKGAIEGAPRTMGFPSKSAALLCPETLIFRSDSNGEDLEGYAGAGLYDSVTMDESYEVRVDYSADPIVLDSAYRATTLERIAAVGAAVEEALGSPQDIEGVVRADGEIFVVQTRPQV